MFRSLGRDPEAMWEEIYSTIADVSYDKGGGAVNSKLTTFKVYR